MTTPLSRIGPSAGRPDPRPPVRLAHLGLGAFFRAHQADYTDRASDAAEWGIAAFAGRGAPDLVAGLTAQDGLYTLVTRAAEADAMRVVGAISAAHDAADQEHWLHHLADPRLAAVTLTVTEAGYVRTAAGGLDLARPEVQADLSELRRADADPGAAGRSGTAPARLRTAPARLLAGIAVRRAADAGPLAIVPCDNLAANGPAVERVLRELAEQVSQGLARWLDESVSVVGTAVDRITPRTSFEDIAAVAAATGRDDRCPVVTEPFSEWVLSGAFPAGRPAWEAAGATFTDDVTPYERRKLWLLNGAHSLMAYAGSIRGHVTVAQALGDDAVAAWVAQWWDEACRHLDQAAAQLGVYRAALTQRFANPRIAHRLAQIAADGSQKLPIRVVPVLRAERAAGRDGAGGARIVAAWVCHLRGLGAPVADARAGEVVPLAAGPLAGAVGRVLGFLAEDLGADAQLRALVADECERLGRSAARGSAPPG